MMDRSFWESSINFRYSQFPNFKCPRCYKGKLVPQSNQSLYTKEGKSQLDQNAPGAEVNLTVLLQCDNVKCLEAISSVGYCYCDIEVPPDRDGNRSGDTYSWFRPKFFFPNLRFFPLPEAIPEKIRTQLDLAFSQFYYDESSSANRVRNAIEIILDEIGAAKSKFITKNSKCPIRAEKCSLHNQDLRRTRISFESLHARIEHYKKKNKEVSRLMLAIKIIGNEGSHNGNSVSKEDLLKAFMIMETILDILYTKAHKIANKIAEEIISRPKKKS